MRVPVLALVGMAWVSSLPGQSPLRTAGGKSSATPLGGSTLFLDANESTVGVRLASDRDTSAGPQRDVCGVPLFMWKAQTLVTAELAAAAEKGKRALFSKGAFTPGIEAEVGVIHFSGESVPSLTPDQCASRQRTRPDGSMETILPSRRYFTLFANAGLEWAQRRTFEVDQSNVIELRDISGVTLRATTGFNYGLGGSTVVGVALTGARDLRSIGGLNPSSVCVTEAEGTDSEGEPVNASTCRDRFRGPLPNVWRLQPRLDFTAKLWRPKPKALQIGLLASGSYALRRGATSTAHFALGPTLHPPGRPSDVQVAALFELNDAFNATGKNPSFSDRFSIRLYAGLPL